MRKRAHLSLYQKKKQQQKTKEKKNSLNKEKNTNI